MPHRTMVKTVDLLNDLLKRDLLTPLMQHGVVSTKWVHYIDIYNTYNSEKAKGLRGTKLVNQIADKFHTSDRTVYLIIEQMEQCSDSFTKK